jgi:YD repeat-containing protein
MVFAYNGDFMSKETDIKPSGEASADFQYGTNTVSYTVSGAQGYTVIYTLDARGYPQLAEVPNPPSPNWAVRYVYSYVGCQMQQRIAYNSDGTQSTSSTLQYSYDAQGHMVRQASPDGTSDTTFDYSCW